MVADEKADFAITTFVMRENAKIIDFLILSAKPAFGWFYIKNPRDTYDWTVFFQPLYAEAWIGLLFFSVLVPILMALLVFFRKLFKIVFLALVY